MIVTTRRRHQYQPDEEERDDPNRRWVYQDDWQGKVDISALDGLAIDRRLDCGSRLEHRFGNESTRYKGRARSR